MSLPTTSLTLLATVKDELGLTVSTHDSYLERIIQAADAFVSSYCNRTFYYETGIVEYVGGFGTNNLVMSRYPIVSITSITYDGSTVSSADYEILNTSQSGLIFAPKLWIWTGLGGSGISHLPKPGTERKLYKVTYVAGYVTPGQVGTPTPVRTLPYDLEDAIIQLVAYRYRQRGRDPSISSESLLNASVSYKQPFATISQLKTQLPQVFDILNAYSKISFT